MDSQCWTGDSLSIMAGGLLSFGLDGGAMWVMSKYPVYGGAHRALQKLLRTRRQAGPVPLQLFPLRACADADTWALPNHSLGVSVCCVVKQNHAGSELSWNQSRGAPQPCGEAAQVGPRWPRRGCRPRAGRSLERAPCGRGGPVPPGAASVFKPPPPGCPGGAGTDPRCRCIGVIWFSMKPAIRCPSQNWPEPLINT